MHERVDLANSVAALGATMVETAAASTEGAKPKGAAR